MTTIAILGGTGFAGAAIAQKAVSRGHAVSSLSRSLPAEPVDGVRYETGTVDEGPRFIQGADVAIGAVSARGETLGTLLGAYRELAQAAAEQGTRLIIIGGYNSLRPAAGEPRFAETKKLPPEFAGEALEMNAVVEYLDGESPESLDWLFVSPAAAFGAYSPPMEPRGTYRKGGDVVFFDENGKSAIAGADFALAIVDEIENPTAHRAHISIAN